MPLGGFCETCGRWVWVTAYGDCENGHPAAQVRDVQQLRPLEVAPPGPGDVYRAQLAHRRSRWWWRYSAWILWTFVPGLSWLGYFYIGTRGRRAEWIASGLVYLLVAVMSIGLAFSGYLGVALAVLALSQGVSILQAFLVRPQFRALMFGDAPAGSLPAPPPLLPAADRAALPKGTDAGAAQVITAAQTRVDGILEAAEGIPRPEVRDRVARLCASAEKILAELTREPRQIDLARAFLTYYLEAAYRIVRGYAGLVARSTTAPGLQETLTRAETSLDAIQQAFDKQLADLLEHEVIDLDSEVSLLEKTVQMDNLMSPAARPSGADTTTGRTT